MWQVAWSVFWGRALFLTVGTQSEWHKTGQVVHSQGHCIRSSGGGRFLLLRSRLNQWKPHLLPLHPLPACFLQPPQTHKPTAHKGLCTNPPGERKTPCNSFPRFFSSPPWARLSPATSSWTSWSPSQQARSSGFPRGAELWVHFIFVWKTSCRLVAICSPLGFPGTTVMTRQGSSYHLRCP